MDSVVVDENGSKAFDCGRTRDDSGAKASLIDDMTAAAANSNNQSPDILQQPVFLLHKASHSIFQRFFLQDQHDVIHL
jgi:hypothetical protein